LGGVGVGEFVEGGEEGDSGYGYVEASLLERERLVEFRIMGWEEWEEME
jgi:hypothetical protein